MSPQTPFDMRPPAVGGPAADRPRQALGDRVRALRNGRGWTLDQAAAHTGLSRSSLSKIEKGQMSPTYDAMLKLARGFGRDITELVAAGPGPGATGRRSITRAGEGEPYASPTCRHRLLAADLSHKTLLPFHTVVTARALEDYPDWDRHDSDDFLYVLTGSLIVYTELYEPAELHAGDSIYMDGRMGHACVSTGETDAVALWISVP